MYVYADVYMFLVGEDLMNKWNQNVQRSVRKLSEYDKGVVFRAMRMACVGHGTHHIQYIPRNMHTVFALLYIDWFSHIHQAYFTGTVAI